MDRTELNCILGPFMIIKILKMLTSGLWASRKQTTQLEIVLPLSYQEQYDPSFPPATPHPRADYAKHGFGWTTVEYRCVIRATDLEHSYSTSSWRTRKPNGLGAIACLLVRNGRALPVPGGERGAGEVGASIARPAEKTPRCRRGWVVFIPAWRCLLHLLAPAQHRAASGKGHSLASVLQNGSVRPNLWAANNGFTKIIAGISIHWSTLDHSLELQKAPSVCCCLKCIHVNALALCAELGAG